ncbi:hypothetical protein L1049_022287 [Liquidambar formosana]|uniref:Uncharacterized protein n=1 Tax=Liquidambar formosana TaxID=63359 RepID=A0AAP0RC83_LIQFO
MDCEDRSARKKAVSVLQGDESFHNRIISREASAGFSSRIYYRSAEGVPFQWETKPGKPKKPPKDDVLPPLSPPPAVQSLGLPKPCVIEETKGLTQLRFSFWKKSKKTQQSKKVQAVVLSRRESDFDVNKVERFEFCSDREFVASPRNSRSSSSSSLSSSSSSFNGPSLQSSRHRSPAGVSLDRHFSCTPWNINAILTSIARRV